MGAWFLHLSGYQPTRAWYYTRMFSWLKRSFAKKFGLAPAVSAGPAPAPSDPIPVAEPTAITEGSPAIINRTEHGISRMNISANALKVLYRLQKGGYEAYLVGGGVRDLLLGREPKDFDVATSATPEEVRALFRNCRLIGRRFRLAHVRFGQEIIEVATFRAQHVVEEGEEEAAAGRTSEEGMILRDNVWGNIEQDAWRRDFTVNALYYNIADFSVVDYTGGVEDLKEGRLRIIGDPELRFREDPVRMLRAVRFAGKLGFRIDERSEQVIYAAGHLLRAVPSARLFDECLKMFHAGYAVETFELLRHYRLFEHLFPDTEEALAHEEHGFPITFVSRALENTDLRIQEGKGVTPAFLFAALLWEPARLRSEQLQAEGVPPVPAMQQAGEETVGRQVKSVAFPKRFTLQAREIWEMQERLPRRNGKAPLRLLEHPRFRAGYDFLLLRAESGEPVAELAEWWTRFQASDDAGRARLLAGNPADVKRRKRRRRSSSRRQRPAGESGPTE